MWRPKTVAVVMALLLVSVSCASPTSPALPAGAIRVNGTVQYFNLEGGFWAVRGDDGVTYDPVAGLSPAFQRNNLRVEMVARVRPDIGGVHMVGPLVDVIFIEAR